MVLVLEGGNKHMYGAHTVVGFSTSKHVLFTGDLYLAFDGVLCI